MAERIKDTGRSYINGVTVTRRVEQVSASHGIRTREDGV